MSNDLPVEVVERGEVLEQIKTQYHTAVRVQRPRDLKVIQESILVEAELAGKAFYYMWPVKNKKTGRVSYVKGPSIGLMACIAREYTNCAVVPVMEETESAYIFTATFIDIEKGFTMGRIFRQDKGKNIGDSYDEDRQKDIIFQIGQSKALRNVINSAVPKWLTDQAVETSIASEGGKITRENIKEKIKSAIDYFTSKGITEESLLAFLDKPRSMITKDDLIYLGGLRTRIEDGEQPSKVIPAIVKLEKEDLNSDDLKDPVPATPKDDGKHECICGKRGVRGFKQIENRWLCKECQNAEDKEPNPDGLKFEACSICTHNAQGSLVNGKWICYRCQKENDIKCGDCGRSNDEIVKDGATLEEFKSGGWLCSVCAG
jgi:hypothetical protein